MSKPWKEITSEEELEHVSVTLKPRFGLDPEVYVPLLWGGLVVMVLFLVFLLPGIRFHGTELTVDSSPSGAQVFIDGELRGATPIEVFVDAGERTLEINRAGFSPEQRVLTVAGRRLGSLFFPRRETIQVVFTDPSVSEIVGWTVEEFSAWAVGPEPGPQFQHPPVARDGARRVWAAKSDHVQRESHRFLSGLLAHAHHHQAADLLGAALRIKNPGGVIHTGSIAGFVQKIVHFDNESRGFFRVLTEFSDAHGVSELRDTSWYRSREDRLSTDMLVISGVLDEGRRPAVRRRNVAGLDFVRVPAGRYLTGYPLRDADTIGVPREHPHDYWIQAAEVTRGEFARFIQNNPEWAPENYNHEASSENTMSGGTYLRDWPDDWASRLIGDSIDLREASLPVRFVPREAARAFADWFSAEAGLVGETARLPGASEWEYAAFLNDSGYGDAAATGTVLPREELERGTLGAHRMAGNLWEWTRDWYGRSSHILPAGDGTLATVMGGGYANSSPVHYLRGGQEPALSSPFLGFRLVIVREESD